MKTNTLAARLVLYTSLWMMIALAVVALIVSADFKNNAEKQFRDLLFANLYNLMGAFEKDAEGNLSGSPQLGDSRYQQFQSGWYWTVHQANTNKLLKSSSSLGGRELADSASSDFDANFQRSFNITDAVGNNLQVVQAQVFLGEGDDLYRFSASGNIGILKSDISQFRTRLIGLLIIFGAGLIVTSFLIVRLGLKPIRAATDQLSRIRDGKATKIEGDFPREINPLIEETNALIKSNQAIIERSRTQVGNLAHSLKTPLSISKLEIEKLPPKKAQIISDQLAAMQSQIQVYLNRAMISARHGVITSQTNTNLVLRKMAATFGKLYPHLEISYSSDEKPELLFAGESQDLEEIIGNILENAGNFAESKIDISVAKDPMDNAGNLFIEIEDDGAGLSDKEKTYVTKRGNRLDESKPGSGLGLSIVKDIIKEYGGELKFADSSLGGLKVHLSLPVVQSDKGKN